MICPGCFYKEPVLVFILQMINKRQLKKQMFLNLNAICFVWSLCRTTLSGDLSSSGFVRPLLEASSLDSFQADLGESGKGI